MDSPAGLDFEILSAITMELWEKDFVILEGVDDGRPAAIAGSDLPEGWCFVLCLDGSRSVTISWGRGRSGIVIGMQYKWLIQ